MKCKKGFLLIELTMGLLLSIVCMVIITHYIIELKSTQQKTLKIFENISIERNKIEKISIKKIKKHV